MAGRPPINDVNDTSGLIGIGPIPGLAPVAAFNVDQVKDLIKTKGIRAYHFKHCLDPNYESIDAGSRVDLQSANLGITYYRVRELVLVPQAFKLEHQLQVQGLYDIDTVLLNVSGNYTDGDCEQVYCNPRDIIALNPSITTEVRQRIEFDPNGPVRLKYKVKGVDLLCTAKRTFINGTDFAVGLDGLIHWLPGGAKPEFVSGKGQVMSVVYWSQPFYIVQSVPHVVRILPSNEIGHGAIPRQAEYAPQLIMATQSHLRQVNWLNFHQLADFASPQGSLNTTVGG